MPKKIQTTDSLRDEMNAVARREKSAPDDAGAESAVPARKILFLDIDDVLNTNRSIAAETIFDNTIPFAKIPYVGDRTGAGLVMKACRLSGAQIVISSSWLAVVGLEYTQQWLAGTGIDLVIYADPPAITIRAPTSDRKRLGMLAYIRKHGIDPAHAVVVDDDEFMFRPEDPLFDRQAHIRGDDGIGLDDYRRIVRLLGGRDVENGVF